MTSGDETLLETPLTSLNRELGGRIVPFAGYAMPVQFEGIMAEHNWTRQSAGLFDVSHMGQRFLSGPDHETTAAALEALTPGTFAKLRHGAMRYTVLLNDDGGIIDDLIVTRSVSADDDGRLMLVVNGARKHVDDDYIAARLPAGTELIKVEDRALMALQGPQAVDALGAFCAKAKDLTFMTANDSLDGRQADASAWKLVVGVEPLKRAEDLGGIGHVKADAGVADEKDLGI